MAEVSDGPQLSVIIPLAPREAAWTGLLPLIRVLPPGSEVIFTGPLPPQGSVAAPHPATLPGNVVRYAWVRSELGRARQLNTAARLARGRLLWFVHADSEVPPAAVAKVLTAAAAWPRALIYFDLGFSGAVPWLMALTAAGVRFRSRCLGLPFGDQAFALSRQLFEELGGFPEGTGYGEDHLLVWRARGLGIPVRPAGAAIRTSARKYSRDGWCRTTVRHLTLTARQAIPEAWALLRRGRA